MIRWLLPGTQSLSFDSKEIPSATYEENNGSALVTVNGTNSLFASFSNGGRTITITTPRQAVPQVLRLQPLRQTPRPYRQPQLLHRPLLRRYRFRQYAISL